MEAAKAEAIVGSEADKKDSGDTADVEMAAKDEMVRL
jgi:hypothetical protein